MAITPTGPSADGRHHALHGSHRLRSPDLHAVCRVAGAAVGVLILCGGPAVQALQYQLEHEYGFDFTADGIFSPALDAAVRQFQQTAQIEVDGIVGPHTWLALLAGP